MSLYARKLMKTVDDARHTYVNERIFLTGTALTTTILASRVETQVNFMPNTTEQSMPLNL